MEQPRQERTHHAYEEEPVELGVVSLGAKDSLRSYETPDDRCVKEYAVTRTCPRAVGREELVLAYVFDRVKQPPCHSNVDCPGCYSSNALCRQGTLLQIRSESDVRKMENSMIDNVSGSSYFHQILV